ncbi:hypothetical protein CTEN210_12907 [Chaetoceros tenuissimus]|uniref:Peptidase C-terminal archaeal/bacterial domain-containing protein n=1 Tax=Chaetoceros tenuissimus TaxID=426638 RepID=A0AAD3HAQ7_9STRA|nr:hypothetical protein CTEN210_12907 [Chaetoceros tenuissimus]
MKILRKTVAVVLGSLIFGEISANASDIINNHQKEDRESIDHSVNDCDNAFEFPTLPYSFIVHKIPYEAKSENSLALKVCADEEYIGGSPAVWYKVIGTGDTLMARWITAYRKDIGAHVYRGSCSVGFTCVDKISQGDDYLNDTPGMFWNSILDEEYYILVFGRVGVYFDLLVISFPEPSNESCENATEITSLPFTSSGYYASSETGIDFTPAIWYKIIGNGGTITAEKIHLGGQKLHVYSGSCGDLTPVGETSNFYDKKVSWSSTFGRVYYIMVMGHSFNFSHFHLKVTSSDSAYEYLSSLPSYVPSMIPSRSSEPSSETSMKPSCSIDAIAISALPFLGSGDTTYASSQNRVALRTCVSIPYAKNNPALFYKVTGTGDFISAKTVIGDIDTQGSASNIFDSALHVYSGSCGDFTCIAGAEGGDSWFLSTVSWDSIADEEYYILVFGGSAPFGSKKTGKFTLRVESIDQAPSNDSCGNATEITALPYLSPPANTYKASSENGVALNECGEHSLDWYDDNTPAVWYKVLGTGTHMLAETIGEPRTFYSEIHVYSGSCGNFTCVEKSYKYGAAQGFKKVAWKSVLNEEYYILIFGERPNIIGEFRLRVESFQTPSNDSCENAIQITPLPDSASGYTYEASSENGVALNNCGTDYSNDAPAVWYKVIGSGDIIRADFILEYDLKIHVYSGSCGDFTCIGGDAERFASSEVTWKSVLDEEYYILVFGKTTNDVGQFTLHVESFQAPSNDSCDNASAITSLPYSASGYTYGASSENGVAQNECSLSEDYIGSTAVWYKVIGTGEAMMVKTNIGVHVYSGSCSDGFTCVNRVKQNSDQFYYFTDGFGMIWNSILDEEYHILLFGTADANPLGDEFTLQVKSFPSQSNESCENASEITSLPFTSSGYTLSASSENGVALWSCSKGSDDDFAPYGDDTPAVWYKIIGNGGTITAEMVGLQTFDINLHVYSGSCGDFYCITGDGYDYYSKVSWGSTIGQVYYIMVFGAWYQEGHYNLKVTSSNPAYVYPSSLPSYVPSMIPSRSSEPSSEPSWLDDEQCKKKDPENDVCTKLDGRCKVDCESDEDFVCVPGLCSFDDIWGRQTKSPKLEIIEEDIDIFEIEITADGSTELKLKKATKAPLEKRTKTPKATKVPKASRSPSEKVRPKTTKAMEKETKATKSPKATKAPKSTCECRVPRNKRGCGI